MPLEHTTTSHLVKQWGVEKCMKKERRGEERRGEERVSPLASRTTYRIVSHCRLCFMNWVHFFVSYIDLRFFVLSFKVLLVSVFHVVRSDFGSNCFHTHKHTHIYMPFSCSPFCVLLTISLQYMCRQLLLLVD
jgi:hypothetical protein